MQYQLDVDKAGFLAVYDDKGNFCQRFHDNDIAALCVRLKNQSGVNPLISPAVAILMGLEQVEDHYPMECVNPQTKEVTVTFNVFDNWGKEFGL